MNEVTPFSGYSKNTIRFLQDLKRKNEAAWFKAHREEYEAHVLEPSKGFVTAMGDRLKKLSPEIMAVPKINRSLFRINRDTRFSPDKSPYKTHVALFFWEGQRPRMECSGYYFHLDPPNLMLGVGVYMFPKSSLDRYRRAVVHPEKGDILAEITKKVKQDGRFEFGGKHYKRVPHGFEASHPNVEFLLHNGLYAGETVPIPEELFSERLVDFCGETFSRLAPLHTWLVSAGIGFF